VTLEEGGNSEESEFTQSGGPAEDVRRLVKVSWCEFLSVTPAVIQRMGVLGRGEQGTASAKQCVEGLPRVRECAASM
jgi:hypothetical protein